MSHRRRAAAVLAAAAVALVTVLAATPAMAQYVPTTTTTRSTSSTTPTTEEPSTSTTADIVDADNEKPAEPPAIVPATVSDDVVDPGDDLTVAASLHALDGQVASPGDDVAVIVRSFATPLYADFAKVDANGNVQVTITIPDDAPPGIYMVFIVLPAKLDAQGNVIRRPIVAINAIVVPGLASKNKQDKTAGLVGGDGPDAAKAVAVGNTPAVAAVVSKALRQVESAGEQRLVDRVVGGAHIAVSSTADVLINGAPVSDRTTTDSLALYAGLGAAAAAAGLLIFRRRSTTGAAR